jgi:pimeloyl-ACP methyl ester carboxylesterase
MSSIKINGLNTKDFGGAGEPLIFVHAFPLCNRMWDAQVEYFRKNYRVITYDVRGLGYSNELNRYPYTMEDFADDLLTLIHELDITNAHVCGLSMGGYITLRALVKEPEKFKSVILADTRSERDDNAGLLNRSETIKKLRQDGKDNFKKEFTKKLLNGESYNNNELRSFVEELISWQSVEGICGALIALATRTTTTEDLREVNTPALILCGEDDTLTPVKFSEQLNSVLKNSELIIVPRSGHLTNIENPEYFNRVVHKFLSEVKS